MFKKVFVVSLLVLSMGFGPCQPEEPLTADEAQGALDELVLSSQALTLSSASAEIYTDFTLGRAAETVAEEIREFYEQQLPCAEVSLIGATLSITYGVHGSCHYNGQTYSGNHSITVQRAESGNVQVEHEWKELSNGTVSVTGQATVRWSDGGSARHVVHELHWTRHSDGKSATGSGDRLQTALDGSWLKGVAISGSRHWSGDSGQWHLDIDDIEARWVDPVPQSGSYTLDTPFAKTVTVSFSRVDSDTIAVTLSGGGRSFTFDVHSSTSSRSSD